jgi:hypothetical protein
VLQLNQKDLSKSEGESMNQAQPSFVFPFIAGVLLGIMIAGILSSVLLRRAGPQVEIMIKDDLEGSSAF